MDTPSRHARGLRPSPGPEPHRDRCGRPIFTAHADVVAAAHDAELFSNAVSRYRQIPNGLDGHEHAEARRRLEPFFDAAVLEALEPQLASIAAALIGGLAGGSFDAVGDLGERYAVRAQSAWLGWESDVEEPLLAWIGAHRAASRTGDDTAHAAVSADFDVIVRELLERRRRHRSCDVTSLLMALRWDDGRRLDDDEVVSILRNWTGGDLSSLALCVGVVVRWLVDNPAHTAHLERASDAALDAAVDEILRLDDPFVSNRRVATRETAVGGCPVAAGEQVVLDWRAANRDPAVFADGFAPERNAAGNLVYGTGVHACPGRGLATLELRALVRALLAAGTLSLDDRVPAEREHPPLAGWRTLPVRLTR